MTVYIDINELINELMSCSDINIYCSYSVLRDLNKKKKSNMITLS